MNMEAPTPGRRHDHRDHTGTPGPGNDEPLHRQVLTRPLAGADLDASLSRALQWLAGWDCPTVAAVAELLEAAREQGRRDAAEGVLHG